MQYAKTIICLLCLLGTLNVLPTMAQTNGKSLAVVLEVRDQRLPDCRLMPALEDEFTVRQGVLVINDSAKNQGAQPPDRRYDFEQLLAWGREIGCRYIVYLSVDRRGIITRKKTSIPYLLNRYVVEGRIQGMYVLIDVARAKALGSWSLDTRLNGPKQWQVAENYIDDPDLFIPAPQRVRFMQSLDEQAAAEIAAAVEPHLRGK